MKRKPMLLVFSIMLVLILSATVWGAEPANIKRTLDLAFNTSTILPLDYKGFAFVNGELSEHPMDKTAPPVRMIDGRVMVPAKLLPDLLSDSRQGVYWNLFVDPKDTKKITLTANYMPNISIVMIVGQKTMTVNGQSVALQVPVQRVKQQVFLPLGAIGKAIGHEVSLVDGLIIISRTPLDLNSSLTKSVAAKAKKQLSICRQMMGKDYNPNYRPIASYQGSYYWLKVDVNGEGITIYDLYQTKNGKASKVTLMGAPNLERLYYDDLQKHVLDDGIYYPTKLGAESKLYRLDFATNKSIEICSLSEDNTEWSLDIEGWFNGVRRLGKETFVVLHGGDSTMGGDIVYRLERKKLTKVFYNKGLQDMILTGTKLYFTSEEWRASNDYFLSTMDLKNDESPTKIGLKGYYYGVTLGWSHNPLRNFINRPSDMDGLVFKDNFLYTFIVDEYTTKKPEEATQSIVRISIKDNEQTILPLKANRFWVLADGILYRDSINGGLVKSDLDGNNPKVLVNHATDKVKFIGNRVYYTLVGKVGLYTLEIGKGAAEKLTELPVDDFWINPLGLYFLNNTYEPGIYKLRGKKLIKLVEGYVRNCLNTPDGILYTKRGAVDVQWAK